MTTTNQVKKTSIKESKFQNKQIFLWSLLSSILCIIVGHGYFLFSDAFSFDTLHVIGQSDYTWKQSLGRFAQPLYKDLIRGNITAPWLIGILAAIFLAVAVFLIAKMLKITSKPAISVITGILGVNIAMIMAVASYTHEFDVFMLAFLLETVAVYIWHSIPKNIKFAPLLLIGSFCIFLSLGLYQAYITVGVSLVIICLIFDCLDTNFKITTLLIQVLKALAMFAIGCLLYQLVINNLVNNSGVVLSSDTNGLTNMFSYGELSLMNIIQNAYGLCFDFFFNQGSYYTTPLVIFINWILLIVSIAGIVYLTYKKPIQLLLSLVLFILLPFAMNCIYFFNPNAFYLLMTHGFFLFYVAVIMIICVVRKRYMLNGFKYANILILVLVSAIIFNNVRFANQAYLKKDLESKAFQGYMNEVFARMDAVDGYVPGETAVIFISSPQIADLGYEFGTNFDEFGFSKDTFYSTQWRFQWYLQFVMQRPIKLYNEFATSDDIARLMALTEVQEMPVFPSQGSIQIVEYVLVVNLSDNPW